MGAIGTGAVCVSAVVLLVTIIMPTEAEAENRRLCAYNLYLAGDQLYIAAQDPPNRFPESIADLVRWQHGGPVEESKWPCYLHCPSDRSNRPCSYYYVPGYGYSSPPSQIIMYDDPANHGGAGGCVLYADSDFAWLPAPQFEAAINSIKLPDGTPYAPHKNSNLGQTRP